MNHPFDAYRLDAYRLGNAPAASAPFVLEHLRLDETPSGSFRPHARLILTPNLRTSGFWHGLPGEEMKTLLLMLTFITPNGWCRSSLPQLAEAMQTSEAKACARMQRLEQAPWRGRPVVNLLPQEGSPAAWMPAPSLLDVREAPASLPIPEPLPRPAGREAVTAWSRDNHARPRAEVEQDIARRMGWGPPAFDGDDPTVAEGKRQAYGQLTGLGLRDEQALDVLARFDLSRIGRQIEWLPHRQAKSPARFLLAAIEGDYDPPPSVRRQHPHERISVAQAQAPQQAFADGSDVANVSDEALPDGDLARPESEAPSPDTDSALPDAALEVPDPEVFDARSQLDVLRGSAPPAGDEKPAGDGARDESAADDPRFGSWAA